jgi:hypothetical protein
MLNDQGPVGTPVLSKYQTARSALKYAILFLGRP